MRNPTNTHKHKTRSPHRGTRRQFYSHPVYRFVNYPDPSPVHSMHALRHETANVQWPSCTPHMRLPACWLCDVYTMPLRACSLTHTPGNQLQPQALQVPARGEAHLRPVVLKAKWQTAATPVRECSHDSLFVGKRLGTIAHNHTSGTPETRLHVHAGG